MKRISTLLLVFILSFSFNATFIDLSAAIAQGIRKKCSKKKGRGQCAIYSADGTRTKGEGGSEEEFLRIAGTGSRAKPLLDSLELESFEADEFIQIRNHPKWNFGKADFSMGVFIQTNASSGIVLSKLLAQEKKGYLLYIDQGRLWLKLGDGNKYQKYDSGFSIADGKVHQVEIKIIRNAKKGSRWYIDNQEMKNLIDTFGLLGSLDNSQPLIIGSELKTFRSVEKIGGIWFEK